MSALVDVNKLLMMEDKCVKGAGNTVTRPSPERLSEAAVEFSHLSTCMENLQIDTSQRHV